MDGTRPARLDPARQPVWTKREFRWLIGGAFLLLGFMAVLIFEVGPALRKREMQSVRQSPAGPNAFVPGHKREQPPFDATLAETQDGVPIDAWDPAYTTLASRVSKAAPGEISKGALDVDYSHFAAHPAELRGRAVNVMALMAHHTPLRIEGAARDDTVQWVHRSYLVDLSGKEGYVVDCIEPLPPVERRGLVAVEAVFLRMATYEAQGGTKTVPLFVGRSMRVVHEARGSGTLTMGALVAGCGVSAICVVFLLSRRVRKIERSPARLRLQPRPVTKPSERKVDGHGNEAGA